jgi:methylase of polypeptide subunit release factors
MGLMGFQHPFALLDLGSASGLKPIKLAQAAISQKQDVLLIGLDISRTANEQFQENLDRLETSVDENVIRIP